MNLLGGVFYLAGTLVKYSFWTVVLTGTLACLTKPTEDSLNATLRQEFRSSVSKDPNALLLNLASQVIPVDTVVGKSIQDFVVVKLARVTVPPKNRERVYVGAFNTWFRVPDRPS